MQGGNGWEKYMEDTAKTPPEITAEKALALFGGQKGLAIDLGCGAGADSLYFLDKGWSVLAIDAQTEYLERLRALMPEPLRARLTVRNMRFEELEIPRAELINATFSLPFCDPAYFGRMWETIAASIKPGGRFAGTFFGDRDEWREDFPDSRTFHSREDVEKLLDAFETEFFEEREWDGTCFGKHGKPFPKHWHVFHAVAKKRP